MTYAFVDRVHRIYGPDEGTPPAELASDSHLLDARITSLPLGALAVYGYHLDFRNAPQLSADTVGARYEGEHALKDGLKLGWALEYAAQQEAGDNAADVDAHYQLVELKLLFPAAGITLGRELLSGERGTFDATRPIPRSRPRSRRCIRSRAGPTSSPPRRRPASWTPTSAPA